MTENGHDDSGQQRFRDDHLLVPFGELPLLSDERFLEMFAGTINGLNHMLGTRYLKDTKELRGPIGENIKRVFAHHRAGRRAERDWEAFRIGMLAMELYELKQARPAVLPGLRRALRRATLNEYFGARFEVVIALLLHRMDAAFEKRESPDFAITLADGEQIFIECASVNVLGPKGDLTYKVVSTLNNKSKKPYANDRTALFIDFTNVLHNSGASSAPITPHSLETTLKSAAALSAFGMVAAFAMLNDLDTKSWALGGAAFVRGRATAPALASFLSLYFPRGEHYLRHGVPFGI